ncbi:MAG: hypothetical protein KDA41_04335, partial [Planctomycetales bacterium]|nr:hypothetical protein [Planctomycetales bacterium]
SPPRLDFAALRGGPRGASFARFLQQAQSHMNAGQPERLMEVDIPLPLLISAASYVDKYGPAARYDVLKFAPQIDVPALYVFGAQEVASANPAFTGLDAALAAAPGANRRVETIAGADHFYTGKTAELAATIRRHVDWL